jgi:hypothetical protein
MEERRNSDNEAASKLWGEISLPEWNRDRFYRLFVLVNGGTANKIDLDDYSRLLMVLIGIIADRRGWRRTFAQHRIEADDAAATVLGKLIAKSKRMKLRKSCPLVLMDVMNSAIKNDLISEQRNAVRKTRVTLEQGAEDFDDVDERHNAPSIKGLQAAMVAAEGVICPNYHVKKAYRKMCRGVLTGTHIPPLSKMPKGIVDKISVDEFATAAYQLNKLVHRYAEDLAAAVA